MARIAVADRATSRRRPGIVGLLAGAALALSSLALGTAGARAQHAKGEGFVYVETNEGAVPGMNAIRAFRRDRNGLLTELPRSPFFTGGTGVHPTADLTMMNLGPFDSDQSMILDRRRTRLFAVNSGSDTIAVFNVQANGNLVPVRGSPFPSGGNNPVSVGLSEQEGVLVVANHGYDLGRPGFDPATNLGNYATFRVNGRGQLIAVPNGTLPAGTAAGIGPPRPTPTQALISRDGRLVFDANFFGLNVRSFLINPSGPLVPVDSRPISPPAPAMMGIPLGLQVHPTMPILYNGFVVDKALGVFVFDPQGHLALANVVNNVGAGPCWILSNAAGTRLYVSNNFENTVGVFDITNPLAPVQIQRVTLAQGLNNAAPFQLALDQSERFLHVVTQRAATSQDPLLANGLNVLKVNPDGTLTVVEFIALPSFDGSRPQGVAAK
jgi:6-phosphogluconolactonase (cycloisomerase 2 family)